MLLPKQFIGMKELSSYLPKTSGEHMLVKNITRTEYQKFLNGTVRAYR